MIEDLRKRTMEGGEGERFTKVAVRTFGFSNL